MSMVLKIVSREVEEASFLTNSKKVSALLPISIFLILFLKEDVRCMT